jgi:zinc transporter, ZIP family
MISLGAVLGYALIPAVIATVSGSLAALRQPGGFLRSVIQHFAAGVVFSVTAVELLPEIMAHHLPLEVGTGFALGVAAMLGLRWFTRRLEKSDKSKGNSGALLVPVGIDLAVDGLLLGVGFAAGAKQGLLLTAALALELASLGTAVSTTLRSGGATILSTISRVGILSLLLPVAALLGSTVMRGLSQESMELVLAFGLAALLYLVTEELLVEAHEEPETPTSAAAFFAGFLIFLLLGMKT